MRSLLILPVILVLVFVVPVGLALAKDGGSIESEGGRDIQRDFVLDGSGVHDIGQLLLHTGNWGVFGSYPSSTWPIAQFPSAMWPAGSGVEHLFVEGIWIGARKTAMPTVSTSAFEMEFRPSDDPVDIIYDSYEGAPGGMRLPSPAADDDGDGMMDEDWLDGRDNDGDGLIDEDYAAISPQMFSSWFTDNTPDASQIYPEHYPLDIAVRMETYQWDDDQHDDFVGVKFTVTNIGEEVLEDVYFGMFTDADVGRRLDPGYYLDDGCGYWQGMRDSGDGEVFVDIGYAFDYDGDGGLTTSYYGTMILGTSAEPAYSSEPGQAVWETFRVFTGGDQPYENGGDPTNDFQRYEAMSRGTKDSNDFSGDVRHLLSTGEFAQLLPGESIEFHVAHVCGDGLEGLLDNAARCKRLFNGTTYEIGGEQVQVHWTLDEPPVTAALDIKPGTCRNPFNIRNFDNVMSENPNKGGVMPVAILGSAGFDVTEIDVSTVRLNGIAPLRRGQSFCDAAGEGEYEGACHCSVEGPDGYDDLLLKFSNQEIAATRIILSIPEPGEVWTLTMTGELHDGTEFQMQDCVTFVGPPPGFDRPDRPVDLAGKTGLSGASPNPFNPNTTVAFGLRESGHVTLRIYDTAGRLVRTLVDETRPAGSYEVVWNGLDDFGRNVSSGIYFCEFRGGGLAETMKMVLLR